MLTGVAGGVAAALSARTSAEPVQSFPVSGKPQQGGFLFGRAAPHAPVALNGEVVGKASPAGLFVVGFDRDEPSRAGLAVFDGARWEDRLVAVAPGVFDIQRIDGLPEAQVTPTDPALIERIKREAALKAQAFAIRSDADDFREGFVLPVEGARVSARWGGQRILNGQPRQPHYGLDLAAPAGTPIRAPAPGQVVLAQPDLHYDGGLTLIDHGQGLISCYLHQSRQLVRAGERVARGQTIGEIGMTGRATGPHLCWRLKWGRRNLDPGLLVAASVPAA
jgi:murein DD-endopeptidase MepM/ murein hydrolase activator NlpD